MGTPDLKLYRTKNRFMYSQNWNCLTSFPIPTFMCLWAIYIFPGSVCRQTQNGNQRYECGNSYSYMEITRPRSFISGNTEIGTMLHLYWISMAFICSVLQIPWSTVEGMYYQKRSMFLLSSFRDNNSSYPLPSQLIKAGYTGGRKTQREVRMADLPVCSESLGGGGGGGFHPNKVTPKKMHVF